MHGVSLSCFYISGTLTHYIFYWGVFPCLVYKYILYNEFNSYSNGKKGKIVVIFFDGALIRTFTVYVL